MQVTNEPTVQQSQEMVTLYLTVKEIENLASQNNVQTLIAALPNNQLRAVLYQSLNEPVNATSLAAPLPTTNTTVLPVDAVAIATKLELIARQNGLNQLSGFLSNQTKIALMAAIEEHAQKSTEYSTWNAQHSISQGSSTSSGFLKFLFSPAFYGNTPMYGRGVSGHAVSFGCNPAYNQSIFQAVAQAGFGGGNTVSPMNITATSNPEICHSTCCKFENCCNDCGENVTNCCNGLTSCFGFIANIAKTACSAVGNCFDSAITCCGSCGSEVCSCLEKTAGFCGSCGSEVCNCIGKTAGFCGSCGSEVCNCLGKTVGFCGSCGSEVCNCLGKMMVFGRS